MVKQWIRVHHGLIHSFIRRVCSALRRLWPESISFSTGWFARSLVRSLVRSLAPQMGPTRFGSRTGVLRTLLLAGWLRVCMCTSDTTITTKLDIGEILLDRRLSSRPTLEE
eukprot:GHVU01219266.1.p1 GENE.GHVU01219266.1~~GHVU01219266.1.p1  ORF type:complete len:111 (-),score=7.17 GHVU01219266.1:144-476(-)